MIKTLISKLNSITFFLVFSVSMGCVCNSEAQTLPFRKYSVADGLTENRVMGIREDSRGFLWLLSKNGLTRFDGLEMVPYTIREGLPSTKPLDIIEDSGGTIWVLTSNGVARYNGLAFEPYYIPEDMELSYLRESWAIDDSGIIWIFAKDKNLQNVLLEFKNGEYSKVSINDKLFTEGEIYQIFYNRETQQKYIVINHHAYLFEGNELIKISDTVVTTFYYANNLLFASSSVDIHYRFDGNQFFRLAPVKKSESWVRPVNANRLGGVLCEITNLTEKYTMKWPYGFLTGIFQDSDSAVWCSSEDGFYRLQSSAFITFGPETGIERDIWSIAEDRMGNIWFASVDGSLQRYDGNRIEDLTGKLPPGVTNFTVGTEVLSDGRIWFTTFKGILEWNGKSFELLDIIDNQAESIYEDTDNGSVFVGGIESLVLIRGDSIKYFDQFAPDKLGYTRSVCKDSTGIYWIITDKSVYWFDGNNIETLPEGNISLSDLMVCAVDSNGVVWIGGEDGLSYYNREKNIFESAISTEVNDPVRSIEIIENNKLIVGRIGDFIILNNNKPESEDYYSYRIYNSSNGFQSTGCVQNGIFRDSKDYIWILGNDRVVRFSFKDDVPNSNPPILYFSGADILSESMVWERKYELSPYTKELIEEVRFKYFENSIRIHFIGISTHNSEGVTYSYKLSGKDTEWSEPTTYRYVTLAGLHKGSYSLQVKASSGEGIWMDKPEQISIIIRPAFWQTGIYIFSIIIIALLVTTVTVISVMKSIRKKQQERISSVREYYKLEMGKFAQQFDPHFTFNVLSSLIEFIHSGKKEEAEEYILHFSRLLKTVIIEDGYTRRLGDELDFIRDYCEMQKIKLGDRLKYSIQVENPLALELRIPRMVLHNFVENSIKWGVGPKSEGGNIDITVKGNGSYKISIVDDGIGREAALKRPFRGTGKGLSVTRDLIEVLNRYNPEHIKLDIKDICNKDGLPGGTKVTIFIPGKYNFFSSTE